MPRAVRGRYHCKRLATVQLIAFDSLNEQTVFQPIPPHAETCINLTSCEILSSEKRKLGKIYIALQLRCFRVIRI